MGRNLVSDNSSLDIITVGKSQMFLGGDVAKHGGTKSSNVGSTNGTGNVIISGGNISSQGSKGVERGLATPIELVAHVLGNLVKGNMSGSFIHDLDVFFPRTLGKYSLSHQLGELRFVIGIVDTSGTKTITDGEGNVVLGANVKDVIPMFVCEVLLVVEDVPLGVDGTTAGDNSSFAVDGHGDVTEEDSSVDGEVINTLLSLLNKSLPETFPGQILSNTINLLQSLINRHGSHGNGTIPHDPLPRLLNVLSCTQIHERVGTPKGTPLQLLNLLFDGGSNGGVSNVGIDLDLEHASDDLGFEFEMFLVGGDDGTSSGNLAPNKLGINILPRGNKLHLLGNHTLPSKMHLSVSLMLTLPSIDPILPHLGKTQIRVNISRSRRIIKIKVGHILIFQMNTTERNLELMPRRFMHHGGIFLGRIGKRITVRDTLNSVEFRIEWIDGGLGALGGFDV
mmetsp:Transcript_1487/g.3133  ORF Transcript_1487/g.3133 Transcript_1487/m.3133 type:complete len:451 (+) Transcript_1487:730-2082(+)